MHEQILAVNRYECKRYAAKVKKAHLCGMAAKKKEPRSALQTLFLRRVQEEMDRRGLSRNAVSSRAGGPAQRTFNDIMNGADPRLENVAAIATALGIQAWQLFRESADLNVTDSTKVKNFPQPPRMIRKSHKSAIKKAGDRIKTGG